MGGVIYSLCAITAFLCALLLLKAFRQSRYKLLLWGGLCFVGLTVSNALLVIDKIVLPTQIDLSLSRYILTLVSLLILLYGLIWDKE